MDIKRFTNMEHSRGQAWPFGVFYAVIHIVRVDLTLCHDPIDSRYNGKTPFNKGTLEV
jgi:hypothetical protein